MPAGVCGRGTARLRFDEQSHINTGGGLVRADWARCDWARARSAVGIANEQAAGMVAQSIPEGAASSRMNAALRPWADATMEQSRIDHDLWGGDHIY